MKVKVEKVYNPSQLNIESVEVHNDNNFSFNFNFNFSLRGLCGAEGLEYYYVSGFHVH